MLWVQAESSDSVKLARGQGSFGKDSHGDEKGPPLLPGVGPLHLVSRSWFLVEHG